MDTIAKALGGVVVALGGIALLVIFGTLFGSVAGWIVGMFFGDTILGIVGQLGVKNISMWQLGGFLGFVGGFLKTKVTATVQAEK